MHMHACGCALLGCPALPVSTMRSTGCNSCGWSTLSYNLAFIAAVLPSFAAQDGRDCHGEAVRLPAWRRHTQDPCNLAFLPKAARACVRLTSLNCGHAFASPHGLETSPMTASLLRHCLQTFVLVSVVFETAVNHKSMSKVIAPIAIG